METIEFESMAVYMCEMQTSARNATACMPVQVEYKQYSTAKRE